MAAYSSEPVPGSTARTTSMATLITASIHITVTLARIRPVEIRLSITFTETRCVVDAAMQVAEVTQVVEVTREATQAEAIARKQSQSRSKRGTGSQLPGSHCLSTMMNRPRKRSG